MTAEETLQKYSTPGLRRNQLSRFAKKDQLSYCYPRMTKEERDKILHELYGDEQ